MSFEALGLTAELVRAVSEEGYSQPTPIQAKAIPEVLKGHDLMAGAQTGTGKTAGFTLPLLQRLMESNRSNKKSSQVSALVVVPTRELAAQVLESARCYGRHLPLRATAIYGGVSINPQIKELKRGVDLLVATPGRLLDHVSQRTVDLSAVEILVLDEADRMLDMGFIRDIRKIMELLPARRQNLLFSATFPLPIKKLAETLLHKPVLVEVARSGTTAERVEQVVIPIEKADKRAALAYLIGSEEWQQVLVFTRTKHGANRLATQLEKDGIKTAAIHGNKSQGARTRALADFKSGAITVLVATDIAARGLDIDQLPHVVNYELPQVPEDYVHRIGRTGRAGQAGEAISLVSPDELKQFQQIERLLKQYLPRREVPGFRAPDNIVSLADHKFERQKPKPNGQGERNGGGNSQGGSRRRRSRRR